MVIYIDANVFILAALAKEDKRAETAIKILQNIADNKEFGITSSLVIDEVVWVLWRETKNRKVAIEEGLRIFKLPNTQVVDVKSEDSYTSLNLMQKYSHLKPRDAIHLAVALRIGVFKIASDDSDFDAVKEVERLAL